MTAPETADRMADVLAAAERAGFTGAIYGPAAFNPGDDWGVRQVFIYRRGACTDRYMTTAGRQDPDLPAQHGHCTVPGNIDRTLPAGTRFTMHTDGIDQADARRLDAARRLGREHGRAGTVPFGEPGHVYPESGRTGTPSYTEYVYWDAGSARLLDALGVTGDTTQENYATRSALVAAYCDAFDQARAIALQTCE
jgi:hypothetical protein